MYLLLPSAVASYSARYLFIAPTRKVCISSVFSIDSQKRRRSGKRDGTRVCGKVVRTCLKIACWSTFFTVTLSCDCRNRTVFADCLLDFFFFFSGFPVDAAVMSSADVPDLPAIIA